MSKNPFDYPEFRSRLALYVSVKDALSCVQVSKALSQDFVYPIWHTIDFQVHKTLVRLDGAALSKHGHLIRVVKGVESQVHLHSLLCLKACKLSHLKIGYTVDALFQASCSDLIRQNQTTLTQLVIQRAFIPRPATAVGTRPVPTPPTFVSLDCLTSMAYPPHSSNLTILTLRHLTLTRNSLTSILRCCRNLAVVSLWDTTLIPSQNFDDYQHTGVTELDTLILDTFRDENPPLFVHFPNLVKLGMGDNFTISIFPTQKVKDCISKWCPKLKAIKTENISGLLITHILSKVFTGISSLTFDYSQISSDLILALLRHPRDWTSLSTYVSREGFFEQFEEDGVSEIRDHFEGSGWMLQSLLRICPNLLIFSFHGHQMDMDEIEEAPWACTNLTMLDVRIKGLDTRDKIEDAIAKWRRGRKQKQANAAMQVLLDEDQSIEARTARHLLRFDKLRTVWLGSKLWNL